MINTASGQTNGKKISPHLLGLFFEDINYAADGGLYAELIQNRSFEYSPTDRREWHPFTAWEYVTLGYSYGSISIETSKPIHPNNPHYVELNVEHVGDEGVGIKNVGFDGIVIREGRKYDLSFFANVVAGDSITLSINLQTPRGTVLAEEILHIRGASWKKYTTVLTAKQSTDSAALVILAKTRGKIGLDVISLFPQETFMNRKNGLRKDLAQLLADMKPKFIRFPGGCLVHGDGLGNMYRWKNTIGPIEHRIEQKNLWGYHQTVGLGYYEYFQFCEDIGAKPLPVLPAAVSCQNSGGTWRIGGTGQKALPEDQMGDYIQEILDLIEWANGPTTSKWGALRAEAGHPDPFNLKYIGIGNEDKITPEFQTRFEAINKALKERHPEVVIVGTVGPFPAGDDFDKGWNFANNLQLEIVDEHYYKEPAWLISNQYRYDSYKRRQTQVYLGEYASWGNTLYNALAEAIYLTSLERNADVVTMASYAPLFAKKDHTQWKTDMIFFDNTRVAPTPNYHVQKLFSLNSGDLYFSDIVTTNKRDSTVAASCVKDSKSGDVILKIVNAGKSPSKVSVNLKKFSFSETAETFVLSGDSTAVNTFDKPDAIKPERSTMKVKRGFEYEIAPMTLVVIRLKDK